MTDVPEPTLHVLSLLLGKRVAKRVYRGSLSDLFLDENVPEEVKARLRASRELVQRWMLEDMRRQPVLTNPNAVREYLALHYAGQEREVFGCLFLDNRTEPAEGRTEARYRASVQARGVPQDHRVWQERLGLPHRISAWSDF